MPAETQQLEIQSPAPGEYVLALAGPLDVFHTGPLFEQFRRFFRSHQPQKVTLDCQAISNCDTSGVVLLKQAGRMAAEKQAAFEIRRLKSRYQKLIETIQLPAEPAEATRPERYGPITRFGKLTAEHFNDLAQQVIFMGHLTAALLRGLFHPGRIRFVDFWRTCETAGADAMGIVSLLGLLFGLIMAFSSAMPLQQFGVEIYVTDLVALGLTRVLGPFITAVILAGRTGSAFAAELGTMKVNNEIDALEVMALDPVGFLVVPRFLAMVFMAPLLTMVTNVAGLLGAAFVIHSLGYPFVIIWNHVQGIIGPSDVLVGLTKAVVYGALVAAYGTFRGLQTGFGAGAVGHSTTRAVVSIIVALVITEGLFSVLLFFLGI